MADGLPVFRLCVGITRGLQQGGREKEQGDGNAQRKNDNREDQQLLVAGNDRERTLQQQPASLKFIHWVHSISFVGTNNDRFDFVGFTLLNRWRLLAATPFTIHPNSVSNNSLGPQPFIPKFLSGAGTSVRRKVGQRTRL